MANLRKAKKELKELLQETDWQEHLPAIASRGHDSVGALFSFLLLEPEFAHRAAKALGMTVAKIYKKNPEAAQVIIRRFMWHMNEDSGNIGWGIPYAFAETLAASPELARNYAHILLSYVYDLGFADNYCDNDALRRECFWGIGRLAEVQPQLAEKARPWLIKGLRDRDSICRGMAAWTLGKLPPHISDAPALRELANANDNDECPIFENGRLKEYAVSDLAAKALKRD